MVYPLFLCIHFFVLNTEGLNKLKKKVPQLHSAGLLKYCAFLTNTRKCQPLEHLKAALFSIG